MVRELAALEIDITNVDINSGYATHSQLRYKSQIPAAAGENNVTPTLATNNYHSDETPTSSNLYSPPRDISELITLSDARQSQPECNVISTAYGNIS